MTCAISDTGTLLAGAAVSSVFSGFGVPAELIPLTGTDGPSPLVDVGASAGQEVRLAVTRWPTLGVLVLADDGAFDYTGASDYFEGRVYVDNEALTADIGFGPGIARVVLNVGAGAGGGSFSGTLVAGDATVGGFMRGHALVFVARPQGPQIMKVPERFIR